MHRSVFFLIEMSIESLSDQDLLMIIHVCLALKSESLLSALSGSRASVRSLWWSTARLLLERSKPLFHGGRSCKQH